MIDVALLILRLMLGAILFAHATQKLFGWFGGNGLQKQGAIFESLGLKPGPAMVVTAAIMELAAATLLVLGLATPLAALIGSGTMLVAGLTMHLNAGQFWNAGGGGEYPYMLAVAMMAVGIGGAGQFSLDRTLATDWPPLTALLQPSWMHAVAIPVVALLSALPFALLLRRSRQQ